MENKTKTFLITNDDGIDSDGIIRLAKAAKAFGKVLVVAPDAQRSGVSHHINLHQPIDVFPHDFPVEGVQAYACSGTPADCVRLGCLALLDQKPDVVLSGINFGYNTATDLQYSGTAGAALEGAFQGCLSIALSEGTHFHEVTDAYLDSVLAEMITKEFVRGHIWNVNFPDCPLTEYKGILYDQRVSESSCYLDRYHVVEKLPGGGARYMVGGIYNEECEPGTDLRAVADNYISIGLVNNIGY